MKSRKKWKIIKTNYSLNSCISQRISQLLKIANLLGNISGEQFGHFWEFKFLTMVKLITYEKDSNIIGLFLAQVRFCM